VLTLTDNAADAVKTIAEATEGMPDDSGLRIQAETTGDGQMGLGLALAEGPVDGDQVIEEEGARVFLGPDAAAYLDDKVLDATIVGDRVEFSLSEQT
jgi:iron-sulfur cluster assembly protein